MCVDDVKELIGNLNIIGFFVYTQNVEQKTSIEKKR